MADLKVSLLKSVILPVMTWVLLFILFISLYEGYEIIKLHSVKEWFVDITSDDELHQVEILISHDRLPTDLKLHIDIDNINNQLKYQIEGSNTWEVVELSDLEQEFTLSSNDVISLTDVMNEKFMVNCKNVVVHKTLLTGDNMSFSFDYLWIDKVIHVMVSEI